MKAQDVFITGVLFFIIIAFGSMFVIITLLMIDGVTEEYKYSIDVPCYDKFSNEMYDMTCEKEIQCGVIFNNRYVNGNKYSCDKDIGLISTSKHSGNNG